MPHPCRTSLSSVVSLVAPHLNCGPSRSWTGKTQQGSTSKMTVWKKTDTCFFGVRSLLCLDDSLVDSSCRHWNWTPFLEQIVKVCHSLKKFPITRSHFEAYSFFIFKGLPFKVRQPFFTYITAPFSCKKSRPSMDSWVRLCITWNWLWYKMPLKLQ